MANFTTNRFGKMIQSARTKKGLTRYAMAQATGLTQTQIKELEEGKSNPTISTINTVTSTLGIKVLFTFNQKTLTI